MKTQEATNLENMALAAELARQLCHEFSNFTYNLYLQLEIGEATGSLPNPENWETIKREGRQITRLLQEWAQFHNRFEFVEEALDLHEVIRQMSKDASAHGLTVQLAPSISARPCRILGSALDCRHLLRLLVEDEFRHWTVATESVPTVSVESESADGKAVVRIRGCVSESGPVMADHGGLPMSLMTAACNSLAVRLGVSLRREQNSKGSIVFLEFPLGE